jgi:hypothetical protein
MNTIQSQNIHQTNDGNFPNRGSSFIRTGGAALDSSITSRLLSPGSITSVSPSKSSIFGGNKSSNYRAL